MTTKYFKYAFGTSGDRASVPNTAQLDGTVSYEQGFPVGYQLDYSDPSSLNIPRDQFNQALYDLTLAVQQIQQNGYPEFITSAMNDGSAYAYALNACVYQPTDGNNYVSLIASNTDVPPSTNWRQITFASGIPAGAAMDYDGTTLPTGWVWRNGTTIGNASSNATGRANADTADLFAVLWTLPSATVQLYDSTGTPVSRGVSAASDYAANRAIATLDTRERATVGMGTMGSTTDPARLTLAGCGFSPTVLGAAGGAETVALTSNQNGAHTHAATSSSASAHSHYEFAQTAGSAGSGALLTNYPDNAPSWNRAIGIDESYTMGVNTASQPTATLGLTSPAGAFTPVITVNSSGLGAAHQNTQPTIVCNKILKL